MNCRRHGRKPTVALWMLVAVVDVALIVASAGLFTLLLILAAVAVIAGAGVLAARTLGNAEPEPARVVARRRG